MERGRNDGILLYGARFITKATHKNQTTGGARLGGRWGTLATIGVANEREMSNTMSV